MKTVLQPRAGATVEVRSLTYRAGNGAALPADLYYDPKQVGPRPILVLISGNGDALGFGTFQDMARLAAERGFAAIVPVKRFPRGADGAESGQADTLALVRGLSVLAPDVADGRRTCLWAFSAGGGTLSVAYGADPLGLRCVIGYYPILSGTPFAADRKDWLAQFSPAHVVGRTAGPHSPPTLIVRAGKDSATINGTIAEFVTAAVDRNVPVTLINLPDARHGFEFLDDTDWAREAIEQSFDFARRHTQATASKN